jgi:hypothetical protein
MQAEPIFVAVLPIGMVMLAAKVEIHKIPKAQVAKRCPPNTARTRKRKRRDEEPNEIG